jgi:hypothetical protein
MGEVQTDTVFSGIVFSKKGTSINSRNTVSIRWKRPQGTEPLVTLNPYYGCSMLGEFSTHLGTGSNPGEINNLDIVTYPFYHIYSPM